MKKISLLILHDEVNQEYSFALGKAISNLHNEFEVNVSSINRHIDLKERHNNSGKQYEIVFLCTETLPVNGSVLENDSDPDPVGRKQNIATNIMWNEAPLVIQFTENDESFDPQRDEILTQMVKYIPATEMLSLVKISYALAFGKKQMKAFDSNCTRIGFYSACGGSGKTVTAIGLAKELSKYHDKNVLYLSFEAWDTTAYYLKNAQAAGGSIGDFLYYLFQTKRENMEDFADGFLSVDEDGVKAFRPSLGVNDLIGLSCDEYFQFFNVIQYKNKFDYVILDLPSYLTQETQALWQICSKMVIVERNDPLAVQQTDRFFQYLRNTEQIDDEYDVIRVRNYYEVKNEGEGEAETELRSRCDTGGADDVADLIFIERDEESFTITQTGKKIDIDGIFGVGLKKVAVRVLE